MTPARLRALKRRIPPPPPTAWVKYRALVALLGAVFGVPSVLLGTAWLFLQFSMPAQKQATAEAMRNEMTVVRAQMAEERAERIAADERLAAMIRVMNETQTDIKNALVEIARNQGALINHMNGGKR